MSWGEISGIGVDNKKIEQVNRFATWGIWLQEYGGISEVKRRIAVDK